MRMDGQLLKVEAVRASQDMKGFIQDYKVNLIVEEESIVVHFHNTTHLINVQGKNARKFCQETFEPFFQTRSGELRPRIKSLNKQILNPRGLKRPNPASSVKLKHKTMKKSSRVKESDDDLDMTGDEDEPAVFIPQGDQQLDDSVFLRQTHPSPSPSKLALEELSSPGMDEQEVATLQQDSSLTPIIPEGTFCQEVRCAAPPPPILWAGRLPNLPANWSLMGRSLPSESLGAMLDAISKQASPVEAVFQPPGRSAVPEEQGGRSAASEERSGRSAALEAQASRSAAPEGQAGRSAGYQEQGGRTAAAEEGAGKSSSQEQTGRSASPRQSVIVKTTPPVSLQGSHMWNNIKVVEVVETEDTPKKVAPVAKDIIKTKTPGIGKERLNPVSPSIQTVAACDNLTRMPAKEPYWSFGHSTE